MAAKIHFFTIYGLRIVKAVNRKSFYIKKYYLCRLNKKFMSNSIEHLDDLFPKSYDEAQKAKAKTLFYKQLSLFAHEYYHGKMGTLPKVPIESLNWFNAWYTPGVSAISTTIRDQNDRSFQLSNRSNMVAVVSDSTRVLGDGDCTPPGGLGVMEGKALIMKYLGGIDATALCIDSRDEKGEHQADKIIEFVKMVQPSFGAVNLEDISQPNCFRVLDVLREECDIPVWHDDAQGTACVTLAGVLNALKIVGKCLENVKIVLYGSGAANCSIARLMMEDGAKPDNIILFDSKGALHRNRERYANDPRYYPQWKLCQITNPQCIDTPEEAFKGADVLVALSKPGPDTIKQEWVSLMAEKAIVFACANPVPEIYPHAAKAAGACIVATGRGDFPNQVNNSVCFPSILKGTLLVSARKITDEMAVCAAHSIADFAERQGISPDRIMPTMMDGDLFPEVAAAVGECAVNAGLARTPLTRAEIYELAKQDIDETHRVMDLLVGQGIIKQFPESEVKRILDEVVETMTR